MHILFSDEEKKWINRRSFGWTIKKGCPDEIRHSIENKKKKLDNQMNRGGLWA